MSFNFNDLLAAGMQSPITVFTNPMQAAKNVVQLTNYGQRNPLLYKLQSTAVEVGQTVGKIESAIIQPLTLPLLVAAAVAIAFIFKK